jgi:hypothetical protein
MNKKLFYVARYIGDKIHNIQSIYMPSEQAIKSYLIASKIDDIYHFIPNSCVKKITGSDIWEGTIGSDKFCK